MHIILIIVIGYALLCTLLVLAILSGMLFACTRRGRFEKEALAISRTFDVPVDDILYALY